MRGILPPFKMPPDRFSQFLKFIFNYLTPIVGLVLAGILLDKTPFYAALLFFFGLIPMLIRVD